MALAVLLLGMAQDPAVLGTPYSDGDAFTLELTLKTKAVEKEAVVYEMECSFACECAAKKEKDGVKLNACFRRFSMTATGGGKTVKVDWDGVKKLDELDWTGLDALKAMVKDGYAVATDAAGNASGCTNEAAKYLVMTLETLLGGAAAALPGDRRAKGDSWKSTVTNDESETSYTSTFESVVDGRAVIASTLTVKDRKEKDAGTGAGKGTTKVDVATGRPVEATISFEMTGTGQTLKFEAAAKSRPAKK